MLECFKSWWQEFSKQERQPGESLGSHAATLCIGLVIPIGIPVAFALHYFLKLIGFKGLFR
jgi:hypothetical protein